MGHKCTTSTQLRLVHEVILFAVATFVGIAHLDELNTMLSVESESAAPSAPLEGVTPPDPTGIYVASREFLPAGVSEITPN